MPQWQLLLCVRAREIARRLGDCQFLLQAPRAVSQARFSLAIVYLMALRCLGLHAAPVARSIATRIDALWLHLRCAGMPGWSGADCNWRACAYDCSAHGVCHNGTCHCADGFKGSACAPYGSPPACLVCIVLTRACCRPAGRIVRFPMRQLAARAPCAACVRAWLSAPSCTSRTGPTPLTGATASARMHATEDAPTPQSSTEMALVSQATARRIDLTPRELRRLVHKDGCVGRESLTIASMARDGRRLRAGHLRSKWHGVRAEVLNDLVPRYFGAPWTDRQRCCCGVAADSVGRDC